MKDLSTYAYINARVRAMLSALLKDEQVERLVNAKDLQDAVSVLKTSQYGAIFKQEVAYEEDIEALEKEFIKYDIGIYKKIINNVKGEPRRLVELLMQRYELDELKALLRIWNRQIGPEGAKNLIRETICHPIDIDKIILAKNIEEIILLLDETPYKKPILGAWEKYKQTNSFFYIEAALDADYFARLWQEVDNLSRKDKESAAKLLGIEIDIDNISWLIRLKQYFKLPTAEALKIMIPRGYKISQDLAHKIFITEGLSAMVQGMAVKPYENLSTLLGKAFDRSKLYMMEAILYQVLFREAKKALAGFPFTIGTILSYLILKRAETQNIISILYSKSYGLAPERIRASLLC